ncbi:MAG: hypothetical protein LBV34_11745 [Nocardiopsaceae bacterium]|jgi:hypothetical protein|nr:hypothetical protein [Nocardiopsaceae bacterium]
MSDIREVPLKVLRGVFSGVGQMLLAADRFRAREAQRPGNSQDDPHGPPTGLDSEPAAREMTTVDYVRSAAEAEAAGHAEGGSQPAAAPELPVPGYDELSLASLRSRLRYLDSNQLRTLLDYERSGSNRTDIVGMFERRIAKIESRPDAS